jgi:hypothetical protein
MHQDGHIGLLPGMSDDHACEVRYCPECGMPAWVEWRDAADTAGSAYVKVRCFARHWFLLLEEPLTAV